MERSQTIPLADTNTQQVLGPNSARRGYKVEQLGSPAVVVTVRPWKTISTDVTEVHTITPNKAPGSGTYILNVNGLSTTALAYNANAATIQAALRLLQGLSLVTVSGAMTSAIVITMTGAQVSNSVSVTSSLKTAGTGDIQTLTPSALATRGKLRLVQPMMTTIPNYITRQEIGSFDYNVSNTTLQAYMRTYYADPALTVVGGMASSFIVTRGNKGLYLPFEYTDSNLEREVEAAETLTPSAAPTAGVFKIKYGVYTTTSLAYNATNADIQAALRLIPGLEAVTVTGTMATAVVIQMVGLDNPLQFSVVDNTMVATATPVTVAPSFSTPYSVTNVTMSTSQGTKGVAIEDVIAVDAVTTPGDSASTNESATLGTPLDKSNSGMTGSLYVKAASATSIKVTEVF